MKTQIYIYNCASVFVFVLFFFAFSQIIQNKIGMWDSRSKEFVTPLASKYKRRTELSGVEIVNSVLEWKPVTILEQG